MVKQPLISVIIPSYNSARFVVSAIESAVAQTYEPLEVIVVDDGSTDETRERLVSWQKRVRCIRQANGGPSNARNRALREAQGELIAFLDADDEWLPEKLAKQWSCMQDNPEISLVHSDVFQLHEPAGRRVYVNRCRERFSGRCYEQFFWANRLITSSVLVTRRCLEQAGMFDEALSGASTEDMDLWFRIARFHAFAYVNEPLVLYRIHASNGSLNQRRMLEDEYYVLAKALKADPALWKSLGEGPVRGRMSDLAFQAGYANADLGDLPRARRYFKAALQYEPRKLKTWAFWASTFLPSKLRHNLRQMKQRLSPVGQRSGPARAPA
jgi:glycosyltransferase involved in cell wall biosynthesis